MCFVSQWPPRARSRPPSPEFLVTHLEQEVCRLQWDVGFVIVTTLEIGVQLQRLLDVYDQLFKTRVRLRGRVAAPHAINTNSGVWIRTNAHGKGFEHASRVFKTFPVSACVDRRLDSKVSVFVRICRQSFCFDL